MPKQVTHALSSGLVHGPGARPDAAPGLRRVAGLRALPYAGPVRRCAPARSAVSGPTAPPACRWCGTVVDAWACPVCGHRGLRAPVVGERRTAEELGRAFPSTPVRGLGRRPRRRRRCRTVPRSSWRPRAPSRWPRAAMPPSCCSTPGWRWRDPTCGPRRRRCAAGAARRAWSRPGGAVVVVGDPAHARRPGAGALGPGRLRPAGVAPRAPRRTCRRRAGWPRSPASPVPSTTRSPARPAAGHRGARARRALDFRRQRLA